MNTYKKYVANVWLAQCSEKHEKGEIIQVANKYGKEKEHIVFNLVYEKNGYFYYSIVRSDGFNTQEHAKKKAEKLLNASINAEKKSDEAYKRSNKDRDFLSLGEPIKVGHHSERRHRKIIEQSHNAMDKCVEFSDKSKEYESKAEYWKSRTKTINLSMPESMDYYKFQLEKARLKHEGLKNGTIERSHGFSLTYANKELKDCKEKLKIALKLWGDIEIKKEIPKTKTIKEYTDEKLTELFNNTGSFFAFSTEQFNEQKKEGIKYISCGAGLICPKDNIEEFKTRYKKLNKDAIKQDLIDNGKENIIIRELYNYECFYIGEISDAVKALKKYGIKENEIQEVYNKECKLNQNIGA